jgi:hypothetical protein
MLVAEVGLRSQDLERSVCETVLNQQGGQLIRCETVAGIRERQNANGVIVAALLKQEPG